MLQFPLEACDMYFPRQKIPVKVLQPQLYAIIIWLSRLSVMLHNYIILPMENMNEIVLTATESGINKTFRKCFQYCLYLGSPETSWNDQRNFNFRKLRQ